MALHLRNCKVDQHAPPKRALLAPQSGLSFWRLLPLDGTCPAGPLHGSARPEKRRAQLAVTLAGGQVIGKPGDAASRGTETLAGKLVD